MDITDALKSKLDLAIEKLHNPFERQFIASQINVNERIIIQQCPFPYQYFFEHSNGGYSKYYARHLYGYSPEPGHNVFSMNNHNLWKKYYGLTENDFCFAETITGNQHFFKLNSDDSAIYRLYIETGTIEKEYDDFSEFLINEYSDISPHESDVYIYEGVKKILGEASLYPIHIGCIQPVLLGGSELDSSNYDYIDPLTHLSICGQLYSQLEKMKPGIIVKNVSIDPDTMEISIEIE